MDPYWVATLCRPAAGVVGMCKEHLGVALALKVPVFFLVTKVRVWHTHSRCQPRI